MDGKTEIVCISHVQKKKKSMCELKENMETPRALPSP